MKIKLVLLLCLFSALTTTLLAAPPQYAPPIDIATNFQGLANLVVADFNGDGKPDFAVLNPQAKTVVVYLNQGNENFSAPIVSAATVGVNDTPLALIAGDFNEDGKQDLIVSSSNLRAFFLTGNGDGSFVQPSPLSGTDTFNAAVVADINHDSHLDFITGEDNGIGVALGDGHGSFTHNVFYSRQGLQLSALISILAADLNADSNLDLVFGASAAINGSVQSLLGDGSGAFANQTAITPYLDLPTTLSAADFNGDGKLDLLIGSNPVAAVIFGNGDGSFQGSYQDTNRITLPPLKHQGVAFTATADANGDTKPDVFVADESSGTMNVYLNDGTGTFKQTTPDFSADIPLFVTQMQVADFNGDGLPDIILTNESANQVSLFYSIRPKVTPTATLTPSANAQLVGTSLSFTAQIAGTPNNVPTGTVTLMDGATSLGQQTLDTSGQSVFSLSTLAAGQHTLSANYSGDANYAPSTATVVQSVTDFQISATTASQTVAAGGIASYTLTITPVAGLTGSLTLTCSQLPALTSCDSLTVPLNGQPATATLNVHTTAPVQSQHRSSTKVAGLGFVSLFLAAFLPWRRRMSLRLVATIVAIALTGFGIGCSSGSSKPTGTVTPGTPSGSTSFTITSTITQGGQTLTHTTAATLVVQ